MRRASKKLFGNSYRAELMLALVRAGTTGVCIGDLAVRHGIHASHYRQPMKGLVELDLAEALAPVPGERRRWHRITGESSLWPLLQPVLDYLADDELARRN